ncbi:hypothetical protein [Aeromonas salmonicida]|uniref:hypothetical protein n=1 Tax=Aeromonas salmonicida TaxID=645 RepID=UPI00259F62CF|nr:hypothetical protein [Aeromonas salmonicida]MDM5103462.1 hypothetical protein [Aeromonas salmonicida]
MNVLKSFFQALNDEEEKVLPFLKGDNMGLLLRCAINELDLYYYNNVRGERGEKEQELLYIMQIGVSRLIKLALESRDCFDAPALTFKRHADLAMDALTIASTLGIIQHGRRVAQFVSKGIGKIEKMNDKCFYITLPSSIEDEEFYERVILEHYCNESQRFFSEVKSMESWKNIECVVGNKIKDLVRPFMEHFIAYDSDPVLDGYFFALAAHEISTQEGYDTYHYSDEFGGVKVQHYMLGLQFMVSTSLRHLSCCQALVEKHPEIKLENILTISADVDDFIESLQNAINYFGSNYKDFVEISYDKAKIVFDVLTYGRDNLDIIDAPGSPHPIFIRNSEKGMIKSVFGAHSEPVRYMLESLRFHFPKDYDKNQANREGSFQRACKRVLNEVFKGLDYLENIKIRVNGQTMSDIDLVVLEKRTGTILLIQLKHQELYGSDIHAKTIRTNRLNKQVSNWMDVVEKWIHLAGQQVIKSTLKLESDWPKDLNVYRMVLSRHYAHSLKSIVNGDDATYANWPQFYNCNQIVKRDCSRPSLNDLVCLLKKNQVELNGVDYLEEPATHWKVNKLEFFTIQEI